MGRGVRPPARVPSGRPYGAPQYPRPRPGLDALTAAAIGPLWRQRAMDEHVRDAEAEAAAGGEQENNEERNGGSSR